MSGHTRDTYEKPAMGLAAMEIQQGAPHMPSEETQVVPDPEANYEDDYMQDETLTKAPRQRPTKRRPGAAKHDTLAATSPSQPTLLSIEESRRWHRRLAHLNPAAMRSLIDGLSHDDQKCEVCIKAKQKRKIVRIPVKPTTTPYELVHSDVCGAFATPSLGGKRYFIVFVDDFSRYTEVFLLADKRAETCTAAFQQYQAKAKARGFDVKRFRCDNGKGEYDNNLFRSILRINGISFEPSPPYAQHKNGISERTIGAITEKARAMMIDSQAPHGFWGEAVMTAAYLHRRTPHKFLRGKSPHEVLNGYNANPAPPPAPIHHLRRFGCRAYRLIPEEQRSDKKLGERSKRCMMVGYVHHTTKLWKLYDPEFKKVVHCSDVEFDEDVNCYISCPSPTNDGIDPFGLPTREPIHVEYYESESTEEKIGSPGASHLAAGAEKVGSPGASYFAAGAQKVGSPGASYFAAGAQKARGISNTAVADKKAGGTGDPLTVEEALHPKNPHHEDWRAAMQEEWASIKLNNTFGLPHGRGVDNQKPITSKWVFKTKRNPDSSIRYKARLVIRGFEQVEGIDFNETYAPVGKLTTLRYMLSKAALHGWQIDHLDVVTAFLNPALDSDVYMQLPKESNWLDPDLAKRTPYVKLLKALYGLKQAPKLWHDEINGFLLSLGFQCADADPNLYLRSDVFIILYVDDILVFYHPDNLSAASSVKAALMRQYRMKDLGPVRQFLGLEISRNGDTITLGQQAYIDMILQRFEMSTAYGVQTPLDPNVRLDGQQGGAEAGQQGGAEAGQQGGVEVDPTQYQAIVGSLMYAALGTRPDITYAVAALSRYNSRPLTVHLTAAKRVLRYLKTTRTAKLYYSADGVTELHGYTDADWAGDSADRKSQGGYTFIMGGAAVSWQSRKQPLIALSTLEAEYPLRRWLGTPNSNRGGRWLMGNRVTCCGGAQRGD
jgi:transposase InsO family protein